MCTKLTAPMTNTHKNAGKQIIYNLMRLNHELLLSPYIRHYCLCYKSIVSFVLHDKINIGVQHLPYFMGEK